ncbi:MAG: hypothetical protein WC897_01520 [Candidatus Gracilibacteria bacterium]
MNKLEDGNYVEEQGLLVPKRFAGLEEALVGPFVIRSEHPVEEGISDLLMSSICKSSNAIAFKKKIMQTAGQEGVEVDLTNQSQDRISRYCSLMGMDEAQFKAQISYSYWQYIPGINCTVVADNVVCGRHHVFSSGKGVGVVDYLVIENGVAKSNCDGLTGARLKAVAPCLVEFYESIRKLFDPHHCPIVEIQSGEDGKNYFLQRHIGRDLESGSFEIPSDRKAKDGEIEATLVRGATPKDGIIVDATFSYPMGDNGLIRSLPGEEDASFHCSAVEFIFNEIMLRRRRFQLICKDLECGHLGVSELFKPEISLVVPFNRFGLSEKRLDDGYLKAQQSGKPFSIPMFVLSDGRRGFVKVLPE